MAEPEARPKVAQQTGGSASGAEQYYAQAEKEIDEKNIKPVNYDTDTSPKVNAQGFQELRPDYALCIKLQEKEQDKKNVMKLSQALIQQGIYVQIRQGNPGTLLVLAKCSGLRLNKQLDNARSQDWLFGVRTVNPGDKDTSKNQHEDVLSPAERLRLVHEIICGRDGAAIRPGKGEWEFVTSVFPLHDYETNKSLVTKWSTQLAITEKDVDVLRRQFGDRVGMYFAFLQYYFWWSLFPTVFGVVCHLLLGSYSVIFAIANCLWGLVFIEGWKRREKQLALRWNINGCSIVEGRRFGFKGEKDITDHVTGEKRPYYSNWKRSLKKLSFVPLALVAGACLVAFQSVVFIIEIFIGQIYDGPFKDYLNYVPTILLVVLIPYFNAGYNYFVDKSTNWENHETDSSHEQSQIGKKFVFSFLTAFVALFQTAYVYLPFGHYIVQHLGVIREYVQFYSGSRVVTTESFELNSQRLHNQVIYFVVTAQIINFAMETIVPYVQRKVFSGAKKLAEGELVFSDHPSEAEFLKDVRSQAELPEYNLQEDYRQLVVQFGYTILFGPVWSLGPLAASVNNWFQLRGDAAKICMDTKRPVPERAETIGPWIHHLSFLSWLGSLTASSIITMFGHPFMHEVGAMNSESVVRTSTWVLIATVLGSENVYLFAKRAVSYLLTSVETPESLSDRRHRFVVRKRYLEEKQVAVASHTPLDPAEQEWASVTEKQMVEQLDDALVGPKTMKDKKSQ